VSSPLRLASTGGSASGKAATNVVSAIRQISNYVGGITPSCNKNAIAFAQSDKAVVGLYVGSQVHRQSPGLAADVLGRLLARVEANGVSDSLVVELCDPDAGHGADYVVGVVINTQGDAHMVQQSVRQWTKNSCLTVGASDEVLGEEEVTFLAPAPPVFANGQGSEESSSGSNNKTGTLQARRVGGSNAMFRGATRRQTYCSNVKEVVCKFKFPGMTAVAANTLKAGNTCITIADKRCTISLDRFLEYNPGINCNALQVGQKVCCTAGKVPPPDPAVPAPVPYCTNWKTVEAGQTCAHIADKRCTVSLSTFQSRNPQLDCSKGPRVGQTFCCNEGRVPPEHECTNSKTVLAGNTCLEMADKRCTVSIAKFIEYNPQLVCNNLKVGEPFCCDSGRVPVPGPPPNADGTCKTGTVANGDSCATLASKCGVAGDYISQFNPQADFCSSLRGGQVYCCGRGNLPDLRPKKNADGSCFVYTVKKDESCSTIAGSHQLTVDKLNEFNSGTWGWNGCTTLWTDVRICLSEGTPPLPAPVSVRCHDLIHAMAWLELAEDY
jgi:hypothetical protein